MSEHADIVIVGGGILGAALSFELARGGLRVTLLEAGRAANGATGSSFAWVNATWKTEDERYHRLNAQGLDRYLELAEEWSAQASGVHPGGALFWTTADDPIRREALRQRAAQLLAWDYPISWLDRTELQSLEPQIPFHEGDEGLFAFNDLWIDTPRLTGFFLDQASKRHADIRLECPATGFAHRAAQSLTLVDTPRGRIETPCLVLAAGVETSALAGMALGDPESASLCPVRRDPGLLIETPPASALGQIQRILFPPDAGGLHVRTTPSGGLLLGADDEDATLGAAGGDQIPPDAPENLLKRAARLLPHLRSALSLEGAASRICVRPMPADGFPIIGALPGAPGIYVAVTHSGVTLGPLLARLLADEILTGQTSPQLAPYSPVRFISANGKV